jgi:hypothetical protein
VNKEDKRKHTIWCNVGLSLNEDADRQICKVFALYLTVLALQTLLSHGMLLPVGTLRSMACEDKVTLSDKYAFCDSDSYRHRHRGLEAARAGFLRACIRLVYESMRLCMIAYFKESYELSSHLYYHRMCAYRVSFPLP